MNDLTIDEREQAAGEAASEALRAAETRFLGELGHRVRAVRAVRGLSRKELSRISGLSERYIAQLESGQGNVSILLLRRIASAIGARLEDLLPSPDLPSDWPMLRDLLRAAPPERIAEVRDLLSGRAGAAAMLTHRVALIGLRGAGKSTLGRMVAEALGWSFVELNREIERENGLSVAEIFALYGQEGYRRLEHAALKRLTARPGPMVLATGGGIVAEPVTFELVLSSFFTIWLKAQPEEFMRRVREQGDLRPMGDDRSAMEELRAILQNREPLYARAHAFVDTSGRPVETSAQDLRRRIDAHLGETSAKSRS